MAASKRAADIGLAAIQIEGGLIAPDEVMRIARKAPDDQMAVEYGAMRGTDLREKISNYFNLGRTTWRAYSLIAEPTVQQTAAFAKAMLTEVFGFEHLDGLRDQVKDGHRYRIAWDAKGGRVPVVVAAPDAEVDAFGKALPEFGDGSIGPRSKRSPTVLLQEWLNANPDFLWGLVFAGDRVRLMRDNASFTRPAYIEADLGAIFRDEMYADFTALWLLIHASRFGVEDAAPSDCALERWREAGERSGTAVRDKLRVNVEEALEILAQGFLDSDPELRAKLDSGTLTLENWFSQILRTVYRLIFLAVAEDRNLLHTPSVKADIRTLYADNYGFAHWRERSTRRLAYDHHHDGWEAMNIVFDGLENGISELGLPALGGLFNQDATPHLRTARLSNRAFLNAMFKLGWLVENAQRTRINWRDMQTEELGSVYESLLELVPTRDNGGRTFAFASGAEARGNARKTSGSYYTPDSLVQTLLDSTLDPVLDRAEQTGGPGQILKLKVIDPACGSGHFLLGAARRMASRVAQIRNVDAPDYQAAMRDVVRNCIHGVDRNPMAVELAKVALWIESVEPGKPLGFLDASILCGDSLLGVFDLEVLTDGIPDEAYKPLTGDDRAICTAMKVANRSDKEGQGSFDWRGQRGSIPPEKLSANVKHLRDLPEDTVAQIDAKKRKFQGWVVDPARQATQRACDHYVAAFLLPKADQASGPLLIPTTGNLRRVLKQELHFPELDVAVAEAVQEASVFHWPLAFPEVMIGQGGFDVVLGNPPWEVVQLSEEEYFAVRAPEIAQLKGAARKRAIAALETEQPDIFVQFERDKRNFEAVNEFARAAGRFERTARGKVNTYALFAEHFLNLTRANGGMGGGRAGIIVPTGIATDATTAPFFGHLVSTQRLVGLVDFENREKLFPAVDSRMKFCLLTLGSGIADAEFSFFLTDPSQLEDERRHFSLTPDQIARINPNTKTAPVFRSRADAELAAVIYHRVPTLIEDERGPVGNPWEIDFRQGLFNMTSDSDLFRTAQQLAEERWEREGVDWVRETSHDEISSADKPIALDLFSDAKRFKAGVGVEPVDTPVWPERYVPLYEAKMFHFFDHRFGDYASRGEDRGYRVMPDTPLISYQDPTFETTSYFYVSQSECVQQLPDWNERGWFLVYKDVTASTNERTSIFSVIPRVGIGNTAQIVFSGLSIKYQASLLANLNSLVLDFVARTKVSSLHLTHGFLKQFPVLPPKAYTEDDLSFCVSRVLELSYTSHSMAPFARDLGYEGAPFAWDEDRRAQLRSELDAWYALAYGLSRDELRYVLDPKDVMGEDYPSETFRVLQKNEIAKYSEYRTQRLVLEAYDQLSAAAPDTAQTADGDWAYAIRDEADVRLLLAAIIKRMRQPRPIKDVALAFLYAAQPHLLMPHLAASRQAEWRRLVGNAANLPASQSVPSLALGHLSRFAETRARLAADGAWRFDVGAKTVDRGSSIYGIPLPPSTEGRADFVWHAMRSISQQSVTQMLSQEEQNFLVQAAVA